MKAGQFSDEQIVAVLQEAAIGEKTISVICQEKGISEATFYAWRKKFHGTSTKDVQKLRELEKENARLKKLLAERDLENDVLKEALSKTGKRSPEATLRAVGWQPRSLAAPSLRAVLPGPLNVSLSAACQARR